MRRSETACDFTDADPNLGGRCNNCHSLPVTTNHSVVDIVQGDLNRPDFRAARWISSSLWHGGRYIANYDKGFYNIGVRRSSEDAAVMPPPLPARLRSTVGIREPARRPEAISAVLRGIRRSRRPEQAARRRPAIRPDGSQNPQGCANPEPPCDPRQFQGTQICATQSSPAPISTMEIRPPAAGGGVLHARRKLSEHQFPRSRPRHLRHSAGCGFPSSSRRPRKYGGSGKFRISRFDGYAGCNREGTLRPPTTVCSERNQDFAPSVDDFLEIPAVGRHGRVKPIRHVPWLGSSFALIPAHASLVARQRLPSRASVKRSHG